MTRWRWWVHSAVVMAMFALLVAPAGAAPAANESRPTERVSPAPKVNPKAMVWRTPTPPTIPQAGDVWVNPTDGGEMVAVPAGKFLLGTSDVQLNAWLREHRQDRRETFKAEQPQCRVALPGYWIDKNLVTVGQYQKFCAATNHEMPEEPRWGWQANHPMVGVTWEEAAAYAKWAGKRLPRELEWEKAARGTDGRLFPWGNRWDASRAADFATSKSTRPVGSFPAGASPYGALDMAGNVWEWCADWYDETAYARYAKGNLAPPKTGTQKVLRGGAWYGDVRPRYFRCADRVHFRPTDRHDGGGFRCARG